MISKWFKTKARFGFCCQILLKVKSQKEEKQKIKILRKLFSTFGSLEIDFGINSKHASDKLSILSELP